MLATFALGTAAGDLTALALQPRLLAVGAHLRRDHLGARDRVAGALGWNPIAQLLAVPTSSPARSVRRSPTASPSPTNGGLNLGDPLVSLIAFVIFVSIVTWVTVTRRDVQAGHNAASQSHPHAVAVLATESD